MEKTQSKYRSWALWVAVAALIVWVVKQVFAVDISDQMSTFLDLVCPILVLLGIINNPNSKNTL